MAYDLNEFMDDVVLYKSTVKKVPEPLKYDNFVTSMQDYGAYPVFNDWNVDDPPANFDGDMEHQLWFNASTQVAVLYFSQEVYSYQRKTYVYVAASTPSSKCIDKNDLKEELQKVIGVKQ